MADFTTSDDLAEPVEKVTPLEQAQAACQTVYNCIDDIGPIENLNQADSKELLDLLRWALKIIISVGEEPYKDSIKGLQDLILILKECHADLEPEIDIDSEMDF